MKRLLIVAALLVLISPSLSAKITGWADFFFAPQYTCDGLLSSKPCPAAPGGGGTVIFSENFDAQADWEPAGDQCNGKPAAPCGDDVPPNWTWYAAADYWNSKTGFATHDPAIRISGDQKRGATGKSFIKSSEANHDPGTSNYYSDGMLTKYFAEEHMNIHMSFWVLFEPTWEFIDPGTGQFKFVRFFHFDGPVGTANPYLYFSGGDSAPIYILALKEQAPAATSITGFRTRHAVHCTQKPGNYDCASGANPYKTDSKLTGGRTFKESVGDGSWHRFEIEFQVNSAPGVADGYHKLWIDGVLEHELENINVRDSSTPSTVGINAFTLGGNWNNWFDAVANKSEQWYAIDDVQICTGGRCP